MSDEAIDAALRESDRLEMEGPRLVLGLNASERSCVALAAEVRRLRAAVKHWEDREVHEAMACYQNEVALAALRARLTPEGLRAAFDATGPLEWGDQTKIGPHIIGMEGSWDFAEVIRALTGETP